MSHLKFRILTFSTNFCPIKSELALIFVLKLKRDFFANSILYSVAGAVSVGYTRGTPGSAGVRSAYTKTDESLEHDNTCWSTCFSSIFVVIPKMMLSNNKRKLDQIQDEEFAISQNKRVKLEGFILYFVQETPVRKYSVPILPRTRKLSVLENYTRTENPFVIAKKTSIINNKVPEIIPENQESEEDEEPKIVVEKSSNRTLSRRQSAYTLPITSPIKTRQRSNTISLNIPPNLVENETEEFVDVRDEILLMKDQFDKLVAVLDDDLLPTSNSPTPSENSQKYV